MSLFSRIFLPVLVVLLVLPLAVYAIFTLASDVYVKREAARQVYQALDEATSIARTYLEDLDEGENLDSAAQGSLLKDIRRLSRGLTGDTYIISLNSKLKITYPVIISVQPETEEIARRFIESLDGGESWLVKQGEYVEITVDSTNYVICATELIPHSFGRAKYIVVYSALYDLGSVLISAGRIVLIVSFTIALATLALLFITYRGVSGSISRISRNAKDSGGGFIRQIDEKSGVKEIDALIAEINAMANRVNRYDADQKAFFQNASHELRTPLMSIRGYAECIECGVFEDARQPAGIIVHESDRLNRRLSLILDISRLDDANSELHPSNALLGELLEKCVGEVRGQAIGRGIDITVADGGVYKQNVFLDSELFDMALGNLLSNAVRHAKKTIEIRCGIRSGLIEVAVRDDGPGFEEDDLPHIFERFYKGKSGVSGLGLSIARTAARRMGGDIQAHNDSGAVVTVSIPV